MARDFAKHRGGKRSSASRRSAGGPAGWQLFAGGVVTGIFLSFVVYLNALDRPADGAAAPPVGAENDAAGEAGETAAAPAPRPRFDFYTLLPEQTIEVAVADQPLEPARDLGRPDARTPGAESYLLQAGSFRQRQDAERRRAELLLLGLEPRVQEVNGDNGRWFRVYLGPFAARAEVGRARELTAAQDIDTLLLKRGGQ